MATEERIKDWTGKLLGYVETDNQGNQKVKDWTGKLLGYYNAGDNTTREWNGRKIAEGNVAVSLIYKNQN